jgi:hypothetical protein
MNEASALLEDGGSMFLWNFYITYNSTSQIIYLYPSLHTMYK